VGPGSIVLPLLLVLSVVRQMRGRRLTASQLAWPIGIVVWAGVEYVRGFPPTALAVSLVAGCVVVGVTLGALAGRCTVVSRRADGTIIATASRAAVVLWTVGATARLLFGLYADHGGGRTIATFSSAHNLALHAWADALTLMALGEVIGRTASLAPRAWRLHHLSQP
jgi:hypothetical protein